MRSGIRTLKDVAKLQEVLNDLYGVKDASVILDEMSFKIDDDTLKYKMIKLKTSLTGELSLGNLDLATPSKIEVSKFFEDTYDGDINKAVSDIIGPLGTLVDPSLSNIVVANFHVNKSLSTMGDGK